MPISSAAITHPSTVDPSASISWRYSIERRGLTASPPINSAIGIDSLANVTLLGEDRVQIRGGIHRGRCPEVGGSGFERLDQLPLLVDFHSYKDHVVSIL
jgi:hypothetical protein